MVIRLKGQKIDRSTFKNDEKTTDRMFKRTPLLNLAIWQKWLEFELKKNLADREYDQNDLLMVPKYITFGYVI